MSPRATGRLTQKDKARIVADLIRLNEEATETLERFARDEQRGRRPKQDSLTVTMQGMIAHRERIISKLSIGLPKEVTNL